MAGVPEELALGMEVLVPMTEHHLHVGTRASVHRCPVALACKDCFRDDWYAGGGEVRTVHGYDAPTIWKPPLHTINLHVFSTLEPEVVDWMTDFDHYGVRTADGDYRQPISFRVWVPRWYLDLFPPRNTT